MAVLTSLGSAAEVLLATDHDPFARGTLRRPLLRAWMAGGAIAWMGVDAYEHVPYLSALGEPGAVAGLLAELLTELPPGQRVTVPRGTGRLLPAWVGLDGTDWDFRWTPTPFPPAPGEDRVEVVEDDAAVAALLAESSPRASVQPGDDTVREWVGVRAADGRLLACAADTSQVEGVGHLAAIAVCADARGQGLGRAVTGALVRRMLEGGCDIATLGMYADNTAGRALYDAMGWRDEHRFTSGPLQVRSRW